MFNVQCIKFNYFTFLPFYLFVLLPFFLFTFSSCDKEERLYGRWRLQEAYMNGDTLNDSTQYNVISKKTTYTFFYYNILTVSTDALETSISSTDGHYSFINKSTINLRYSIMYNVYNIDAKINKLSRNELNLEYDDKGNHYLLIFYTY